MEEPIPFDDKQLDNLISEYEAAEKVSLELGQVKLETSETLAMDETLKSLVNSLILRQTTAIQLGLQQARLVKQMVELAGDEGDDEEGDEEGDDEDVGSMLMLSDSDSIIRVIEGYIQLLEKTISRLDASDTNLPEFKRLLVRAKVAHELVLSITIEPEEPEAEDGSP